MRKQRKIQHTGHPALFTGLIIGFLSSFFASFLLKNYFVGIIFGISFGLSSGLAFDMMKERQLSKKQKNTRYILIWIAMVSFLLGLIWIAGKLFFRK